MAAVAFLFVHARARIGIACALAIAALVWFDADFQRLCNQVMSDVPGVALLFACLAVERWARAQPSLRRDLVLAACIGVSLYVRSVIVMLVPAIFVARTGIRFGSACGPWTTCCFTSEPHPLRAHAPLAVRSLRDLDQAAVVEARMFQHELDHLHGVLMFDRMTPDQRKEAMTE